MFTRLAALLAFSLATLSSRGAETITATAEPTWGTWQHWGDQRDGTYRNPVLPADYSDIDCIRVGSDYYAISSTFQFSPGMVILKSKDLVNWTIAGHAITDLTQIGPELNWDRMNRYGRGVWAGSLRYHEGKFWLYFGTPDEGYFMTTAKDPSGPWEPLHAVLRENGWDDPCPFWDDNGQGYFVGTKFSDGYKIHLFKLTPDGRDLVKESDRVIHQSKGSEANKLYKIKGTYYHLFSEVKAEGRTLMMERAQSIDGPYEIRQLSHADRPALEPNQGGLVETESGGWYFYTHHGTGSWEGRCSSLLPVTWVDGWPIIGEVGPDGIGHMAWSGKMPVPHSQVVTPQSSDDFATAQLSPQWEWNYQPRTDKWSLTSRPGWLRLHAFRPLAEDNLMKAGNTLTQRSFRTAKNEVVVKLDLRGMVDGQKAGLCHFAKTYSTVGVAQHGDARQLEYRGPAGTITAGPRVRGAEIWLRSTWGLEGKSQYSFSEDGKVFTEIGEPYPLTWGNYRGDRLGIFCYNNENDSGYVDVDFFHYTYDDRSP